MPNKLYPTDVLQQAQTVLSAWNQISATLAFGTLNPAAHPPLPIYFLL